MSLRTMIRLADVIDALGEVPDRLSLQKSIYLLQKMGFDLGFSFDWYTLGPFSVGLARTMSRSLESGVLQARSNGYLDFRSGSFYGDLDRKNRYITSNNELLSKLRPLLSEGSIFMECVGSLLYLATDSVEPTKSKKEAFKELKQRKPGRFTNKLMKQSWKVLSELGLIPSD